MRFWDSSALVPLLFAEERSRVVRPLFLEDRGLVWWWSTPVECASALWRRHRAGDLDRASLDRALAALESFQAQAETVMPEDAVRVRARQLLKVHALGSADALQLAAALAGCRSSAADAEFVCFDRRLREAARREGFLVLPPGSPSPERGAEAAEVPAPYGRVRRHTLTKIRKR